MTHRVYQKLIIISAAIVVGLFAFAPAALAQTPPNLEVIFVPNPLFEQVNFTPGETTSGYIQVKNNTAQTQKVQIEAIKQSNEGGLAEQLDFVVKQGATPLYEKTLKQFFDAGEVFLSDVASGATVQYDISVTFKPEAGNGLQGKNTGFDLLVGFLGQEGGVTPPTVPGTSSGGGGGISGLLISNEASPEVTEGGATITWLTTYKSTSRVIYGTIPGIFDFSSPPNYGYASSTVESDTPAATNGAVSHTVNISGLLPGTTYYYRVISHASPDTISYERNFTTKSAEPGAAALTPAATATGNVLAVAPAETGGRAGGTAGVTTGAGQVAGASQTAGTGGEPGEVKGQVTQAQSGNAVAQSVTGCQPLPWWPLGYLVYVLLLIAVSLLWGRFYFPVSLILLIAAVLLWWLEPCGLHSWYWPVIILFIYLAVTGRFFVVYSPDDDPSQNDQKLPLR